MNDKLTGGHTDFCCSEWSELLGWPKTPNGQWLVLSSRVRTLVLSLEARRRNSNQGSFPRSVPVGELADRVF